MDKKLKGALSIIIATMSYGMFGIYSRFINNGFQLFTQNWIRNLIVVCIIGIFLLFFRNKIWKKFNQKDIIWILLWSMSGIPAFFLFYIAVQHLQIGTSYFLLYSTMIVGGYICGKVLFKETLNTIKVFAILLSFIGLSLIYSVEISGEKILYIICALLAGAFTAIWNTLSKKFSDKYPNLQLVWTDACIALITSLVGSLIFREIIPPINGAWVWIVIFAFGHIVAVSLIVYGFKNLDAQIASIIMPIEVIFATLFGYLFFKEIPQSTTLIGGIFIALAAALPNIGMIYDHKKNK